MEAGACVGIPNTLTIFSVLNEKVLVGTFNQEKALVGAYSVILKLQISRWFVCSSSVRVTMRGDMNGDGVCISLALAPASIPGPCPGPGPPGTTGQWAAAPGRGHRRYPPPRPPAQQSDPSCPIATSTSSHTNIAHIANIWGG